MLSMFPLFYDHKKMYQKSRNFFVAISKKLQFKLFVNLVLYKNSFFVDFKKCQSHMFKEKFLIVLT